MTILVSECVSCHRLLFPARELCPYCGSARFEDRPVESGVVLARTHVRRTFGETLYDPIHLCLVGHGDLRVIARTYDAITERSAVTLTMTPDGRIVAAPSPAGSASETLRRD